MIRTAISLANKGMAVFPCVPRDKRPATANGLKDATTDPETIRQWWHEAPHLNIAIATGAGSGIFVVDVDGFDGELALRMFEDKGCVLPPTVEVITGDGRHLYFKMPDVSVRNSASKIAPGIDVRGDGGYVLAPPSIHPSGRAYAWSVDSASAIAAAPDWLLAKITERANGNGKTAVPSSEWRTILTDGVAEGARDCTLAKFTGYLLRRYVDPVVVLELMQLLNAARCTPPLPQEDVERIVNSICGKELKRRGIHAG